MSILVYEKKNGLAKYIDRMKDFDQNLYTLVPPDVAVVLKPEEPEEIESIDAISPVSTVEVSEEARFKELTDARAWLRPTLRDEYKALKAKLNP